MNPKIILIFILIAIANTKLSAQNFLIKTNKEIFLGFTGSTSGVNPFWLRTNEYGTVPLKSNYTTFGGKIFYDYDSTYTIAKKLRKLNWGYGIDAIANLGNEKKIYLPEAYAKIRFGAFELYLGKRKEISGIVDSTLSSGSFSLSGNAMPIPKLQLSLPNYVRIDRRGLISLKGGYAHGYFDNDRQYTKNVKLHQKWLYFKLGKPDWKINLTAGFNHQVMWGGQSPFYSNNGQLPDGIKNYKYVVLGTRGAISDTKTGNFDENRVGNHLGSIDVGASLNTDIGLFNIYRQSFYEDGSLFYLLNITDGLNGVSLKSNNKLIEKVCFEYLNTTNQGGNQFIIDNQYLRGGDNYYINSQYLDGYSNKNKIMGTPFIQIRSLNWGNNKANSDFYIDNTRVRVFHLGINGSVKKFTYIFKSSFSKNFGMYTEKTNLNQFSFFNNLNYHFLNTKFGNSISLNTSFDIGQLYPNSFGGSLKYNMKL